MERIDPHNIIRGPVLNTLRLDHPRFIADRLEFAANLSVSSGELWRAYGNWLGVGTKLNAKDLHNLYALLVYLGIDHNENTKTFYGVRLR